MFPDGFNPNGPAPQSLEELEQMMEGMFRGMMGDEAFEQVKRETEHIAKMYQPRKQAASATDILDARRRLANGAAEGHKWAQRMLDIADEVEQIATLEPFSTPYDQTTYKPNRFVLGWHGRGRKGDQADVWFHETFETLEAVRQEVESVELASEHIPGYIIDLETGRIVGDGSSGKIHPMDMTVQDYLT